MGVVLLLDVFLPQSRYFIEVRIIVKVLLALDLLYFSNFVVLMLRGSGAL
jgi:hypothetical protein